MPRLSAASALPADVATPGYDPSAHGCGIVHLGLGAFHRAHQAVYTDDALACEGGDWRITGVSLRSTAAVAELAPQACRYTLIERGEGAPKARVIGSLARALSGATDMAAIRAALADPRTRIVSLTVTEKAYGIDRATKTANPAHSSVAADLAAPEAPTGVLGLLMQALGARRAAGAAPFTVLCCDNLPENGALLRGGVVDFARRLDPALADWIAGHVAFPSTMVDRITPAQSAATLRDAERLTGYEDRAAIETEPFSQWVIEDHFPAGRPAWDRAGAIFVADVAPYERMKLRMLNGTHSMLAYAGFLAGHRYVRDTMTDPALAKLIRRHLAAAGATLTPLPGIDFAQYAADLQQRFANPAIAHETYQIAMDGTEKLPPRLLQPALELLKAGGDLRPFAFAVAAWMRYALGRTDAGEPYPLRDPKEADITNRIKGLDDAEAIVARLSTLPGLMPPELANAPQWRKPISDILATMMQDGVAQAVNREVARE